MKSPEEIDEIYENLRYVRGRDHERMRYMRMLMNNEMPVPLPELNEQEQSTVANLALNGQDQLARRLSSVEPTMYWPNLDPGKMHADRRAKEKPRVIKGFHEANLLPIKLSKRARFFLSYAETGVLVRPNRKMGMPKWQVVSPLDTYLPRSEFDDYLPTCVIFTQVFTYGKLVELFGEELADSVSKPPGWDYDNKYANYGVEFEVLTYNDEYEYSMILLGYKRADERPDYGTGRSAIRLTYAENLVGRPLFVCAGRITLDAQLGHFDGIVGMYQTQAALMALTVIAQRKTVWPTTWLKGFPNDPEDPEIIVTPDPYKGIPGQVRHGEIEPMNLDPAFRALEIMDRHEEAMRKEAGLPAEFGGMSATNIRTGRRGAQVMGSTIDFTIQEAQAIFAASIKEENKLAIAIDKAYFNRKKVFYIESRSYVGAVEYTPSELWDSDAHVVDYPFAGTDLQNLTIEAGQRVAMGTMSRETFMEHDPAIRDVPAERQKLLRQAVEDSVLQGLTMLTGNPEGPMQLPHIARLDKKIAEGKELYEAMLELQEEVQAEQATPAEVPAEAQPGIAQPGQGVEQPEAIPEMDTSMNRMTQLLGSMGTQQMAQKFRK
jgi:hypothetical protein